MSNSAGNSSEANRLVLTFFGLTFLFSWILWLPGVLKTYGLIDPGPLSNTVIEIASWVAGIGPSLIAIMIVQKQKGGAGVKALLSRVLQFKLGWWFLPCLFLIPVTLVLAHLTVKAFFGSSFPHTGLMSEPGWIPVVFVMFLIMQAGEEFGWRGFALDNLQRNWGALTSSLIIGVIWALWHLPMFFSEGFGHHDKPLPFDQFFITLVLLSIIITWIQNNTGGSLVPAFVLHAMINLSGEVLPLVSVDEGKVNSRVWVVTNLLLFVFVIIVAIRWGPKKLQKDDKVPR
jgi:membrane protease YdiL (CAAX protease family)